MSISFGMTPGNCAYRTGETRAMAIWSRSKFLVSAAAALIARADASLDDPFLPEGRGRDESKALYERAARADPDAYYPRFQHHRFDFGLARMQTLPPGLLQQSLV